MGAAMQSRDQHGAPTTLVVGLGESGYSVVRFLARHGQSPAVADSRAAPPMIERLGREHPGIEVKLGAFDTDWFRRFDRIVVSPGVSVNEPAVAAAREAGATIVGDVELFAALADAPVIGVTGSNGKSTVTALVGELLAAAGVDARVGGNIGVPVLDLLDEDAPDFYVLELSSFQLETTASLALAAAVVLNISPDHMDRYATLADYARAKGRIFRHCRRAVVNRDDDAAAALAPAAAAAAVHFGLSAPAGEEDFGIVDRDGRRWLARGSKALLAVDEIRLEGSHNLGNMLAALALVAAAGIDLDDNVLDRARRFAGLPHRMERVAEHHGVRWINDSKGTNVGATCAALRGVEAPIVLLAGGVGKGADFAPLAQACAGRVRHALLIGEDADAIARALPADIPVEPVESLAAAVTRAAALATAGDVVLFSPACASFDMFRNFEHRGDVFRALVQEVVACRR